MAQCMPRLESESLGTYSLFIKCMDGSFSVYKTFVYSKNWPGRLTQEELEVFPLESLGHLTQAGANIQTIH